MNRIELEKLKWKCRRGLLELDIVLDRYLKAGEPIAGLSSLAVAKTTNPTLPKLWRVSAPPERKPWPTRPPV